jgi:PadR family transcriptional regulator PadR
MQQHEIDVIGSNFFEETRDHDVRIGPVFIGNAAGPPPDFADDGVIVPGNAFERRDYIRMRAIKVGEVEHPNAALVRAPEQRLEILLPHPRLIGFAVPAADACSHANAAPFEFRLAQRHLFVWLKIFRWNIRSRQLCADQHAADAQGRLFEEFATFNFHMGIVLKVPVTLRQQLNMSYKRAVGAREILSDLLSPSLSSGGGEGECHGVANYLIDIHSNAMHSFIMLEKELIAASTEPLILSLLSNGESYGYALIQEVKRLSEDKIEWTDGMLYPVLHRMEARGWIKSRWGKSENGRKRKYYAIKKDGHKALSEKREQWTALSSVLRNLWKEQYV